MMSEALPGIGKRRMSYIHDADDTRQEIWSRNIYV